MLSLWLGHCAPNAAFLPISSLNLPVADASSDGADFISDVIDTVVDPTTESVEDDLVLSNLKSRIPQFLASLSLRQQEVARRYYWLDQPASDIADELGVSRSAISHMLTAINRLGRSYFGYSTH